MIFKGVAPSIRYSDPEYFRFELRLHWQYIALRVAELNEKMRKVMVNFGVAMKMAGESMKRITQLLKEA